MKTIALAAWVVVSASIGTARAEEAPPPAPAETAPAPAGFKNGLFVEVLSPLVGVYSFGYERVIGIRLSVLLELDYMPIDEEIEDEKVTGRVIVVSLEPHLYPRGRAQRGFYVAPKLFVASATATGNAGATGSGAGATVGWSWVMASRINLKLGIGASYLKTVAFASDDETGEIVTVTESGFVGELDLRLGFLF